MRHERSGRVAARQFGVSPSLPLHGGQSGLVCIWAPYEGKSVTPNRAGNLARRDVPTCSLGDRADTIRQQLQKNGARLCAVLNEHRVLLGQISAEKVESETDGTAEEIMTSAPTTFRPNAALEKLCEFFRAHKAETVWVTTNDGELLGLLYREDVQRAEPKVEEPACMH